MYIRENLLFGSKIFCFIQTAASIVITNKNTGE